MILFYVRMVRRESLSSYHETDHYWFIIIVTILASRPVFMLTFQKLVNWVGSLIGIAVIMDHVTQRKVKRSWSEAGVLNCQKDFKRVA